MQQQIQPPTVVAVPKVLRMDAAAAYCGLARSTVYERLRSGDFPQPRVSLGKAVKGWLREDLDRWIDSNTVPDQPDTDAA